jgi:hypothetical protein
LWRALVAWGIVVVAVALFLLLSYVGTDWTTATFVGASTIFVAGAAWAVVHTERGLQDHIAHTYLVPQ